MIQGADRPETLDHAVRVVAKAVEVGGVLMLVVAALVASGLLFRDWRRAGAFGPAYKAYRRNLGRGILLGLEFLVIADIIRTVAVEPSFNNLGVLAIIVLIRTFLSFALEVEIEGRFPWNAAEKEDRSPGVHEGV
ncbi:MAG: DUF1622 domain-containing protein [Gemmatimonadetes bacterium]|nr:DUF1622 domain-containing protein [Gemmatimonadota bacterium]